MKYAPLAVGLLFCLSASPVVSRRAMLRSGRARSAPVQRVTRSKPTAT